MIADTLNNSSSSGISDTETFSCHTIDECLTACRTVQCYVTDNVVLILFEVYSCRWINDQLSAGKSLSEIIVGISHQFECQSLWNKGTKTLSAGSAAFNNESILIECIVVLLCNL